MEAYQRMHGAFNDRSAAGGFTESCGMRADISGAAVSC